MPLPKIIDNSIPQYQMKSVIAELLGSDKFTELAIATGYWDLPGMVEIFDELSHFLSRDGVSFRLLLGEEPSVKAYQVKNPQPIDPDFPQKYLKKDLEELDLKPEFQKVATLLSQHLKKDDAGKSKLQIKVYKKNFLHAKCYIFGSEHENAVGIIGSSNFTKQGLAGNLELNSAEDNNATVNYRRLNLTQHPSHRSWFEDLWNESEDWSLEFKEEILDVSRHGNVCFSPYEMYIHSLYRIYGEELKDEAENYVDDETADGKPRLLKFQIQNANSLIKKLERQRVAMLSDSVGLGKTYTAIKVIEYYKDILKQRVVIICPASLIDQWQKAISRFQMTADILSLQDTNGIERFRENTKSYPVSLFVIDESHNLKAINGDRFETIINWKMSLPEAKTLLLTATPINNQLSDLTHQIILGTGGEVQHIGNFFDRSRQKYFTLKERLELINKEIKAQIRRQQGVDFASVKEQLTPLLNKVIVRRTRQGIMKEHPEGLEINGKLQKFPKSIPDNLEYRVQKQAKKELLKCAEVFPPLTEAFSYTIESLTDNDYLMHPLDLFQHFERRESEIDSALEIVYTGILALGFPCYRYNIYRTAYYGRNRNSDDFRLDQTTNLLLSRQIGMYGIFRTIFLKRLESSLYSINLSLGNYKRKLLQFEKFLLDEKKIISVKNMKRLNELIVIYNEQSAEEDQLDFNLEDLEVQEEGIEIIDADEAEFRIENLKADIKKDLSIIAVMEAQLSLLIKKDNKIQVLADKLNEYEGNKVLVFSYFADTVKYLRDNLPNRLLHNQAAEFAIGSKAEIEGMANRFAPVSKEYTMQRGDKDIQILVATDKLSEGQNLQDCGIIINYDLHWNPVRMIQRNGRINRLGSTFDEIFIYNFRPEEELESYLLLVRKLEAKINLIRYTIGSDQSVLDEEPIPQQFTEDLYSKDEKARIKAFEKILETSELLAVDNLFLDDLRDFDENENISDEYKEVVRTVPKGKWARIIQQNQDLAFDHVVHILDDKESSGYFVGFRDESEAGERIATSEGLLLIRSIKENNERYVDRFQSKVEFENKVRLYIQESDIPAGNPVSQYNINQTQAINILLNRMIEYGYPVELVTKTRECIYHSQNAYVKKQIGEGLRKVRRRMNQNEPIDNNLIDLFTKLSIAFTKGEISEVAQLSEFIHIFSNK